ncbi:MAG: tyrosine-type recombinase/integrase [Myxococcota bacterium]
MSASKKSPRKVAGTWLKKGVYYSRDPEGRAVSLKTSDPKMAELLVAKWKSLKFEEEFFPNRAVYTKGTTLKEAVVQYLAEKAHKKSIDDDRERLQKFMDHVGPETKLLKLERKDFVGFLNGLDVKPATRNRYRAALNTMMKVSVQNGLATENPVQNIELLPEHNERDRIATQEELEKILEEADDELRALVTIAFWTGMRLGEILGIRPNHIDWKAKSIKLGNTKNGRSRTVPMPPPVEAVLKGHERFLSTSQQASKRFHDLVQRLGIEDLRFHDLRHTACTRMRAAGVDLFTMASISGHESLEMLRRYQTITPKDQLSAMKRVMKLSDG